jgi:hypothetical protein
LQYFYGRSTRVGAIALLCGVGCPAGLRACVLDQIKGDGYSAALNALMAGPARFASLRHLSLAGRERAVLSDAVAPCGLRGVELPSLETFLLHSIRWAPGEDPAPHLAAMKLPRLRTLWLDITCFKAVSTLAAAPWMAGVEELGMTGEINVTSQQQHWLEALKSEPLPSLKALHAGAVLPDDEEPSPKDGRQRMLPVDILRLLAQSPWLPHLTCLTLRFYALRDDAEAAAAWAALAAAPLHSLRRLDVGCMLQLTKRTLAVRGLAKAPWLTRLEALRLPDIFMGEVAQAARALPVYRELEARGALFLASF